MIAARVSMASVAVCALIALSAAAGGPAPSPIASPPKSTSAVPSPAAPIPASPGRGANARAGDDAQDLIYIAPRQPIVIRLHIRVDGQSLTEFRKSIARPIFDSLDLDKNGVLEGKERDRIPTPAMLQMAARLPANPAGPNDQSSPLPTGGRITFEEFSSYALAHVGSLFAFSVVASSDQQVIFRNPMREQDGGLDMSLLLAAIDADGDGKLTPDEFARVDELFRALDVNDDEVITRTEIAAARSYGQTAPSASNPLAGLDALIQPIDRSTPKAGLVRKLIQLYDRTSRDRKTGRAGKDRKLSPAELGLPPELLARFDKNGDGALDTRETAAWLSDPTPQIELDVALFQKSLHKPTVGLRHSLSAVPASDLSIRHGSPGQFVLRIGSLPIELRAAESSGRPVFRRENYKSLFKRADQNNNGYLEPNEIFLTGQGFGPAEFAAMDRDHNGMVFEDEWLAFVELRDDLANSRITFTLTATPTDPITLFDSNNDGRLSHAEFVRALATIRTWDKNHDERITADEIPRHFYGTFALGQAGNPRPRATVMRRGRMQKAASGKGPDWFQRMDRNGDGEVSFREFLGPLAVFRKLDANHDGFLDSDEAAKFVK